MIGHAIYTLSDLQAFMLKEKAREPAEEKGSTNEFKLYDSIWQLSPEVFS